MIELWEIFVILSSYELGKYFYKKIRIYYLKKKGQYVEVKLKKGILSIYSKDKKVLEKTLKNLRKEIND